ncbi:M20/M25/M40 family metallo-hydrolase [bacterium]|nr:M20/M25/M40 family metallo-hydrolase [bacterium]
MKKSIKGIISLIALFLLVFSLSYLVGCDSANNSELASLEAKIESLENELKSIKNLETENQDNINKVQEAVNSLLPKEDMAEECYEKLKYIDTALSNRDAFSGSEYLLSEKWITWTLMEAGYQEKDIVKQNVEYTKYCTSDAFNAVKQAKMSYVTDGLTYSRSGRNYVEDEEGTYQKVTVTSHNLILKKPGKSNKQIIVGGHFDGDGTGDNGSGVSLMLTIAEKIQSIETPYTIVFVFFTLEEYGLYGSKAYVDSMTDEEIANTIYMINIDSIVCGDYCSLYSGVQDDEKMAVEDAEPYYNALNVAEELGLTFYTNPWTYDNPAPGYDSPDYASPSTGDWSDHAPFAKKGIKYLYFEATNWYIPGPYNEYDGYGESYIVGMLMNTKNDYLDYIEKYYPGRPYKHFDMYSKLLMALVTQDNLSF